ncbi:hypothetical protein KPH14_000854 [Odynerus spinipes]|uniref:Uncharacterized protein n=1 Tax=Odynerus spinipes TaxID=1348599 RepID=A0AAD9RDC2_9HYME|nr:hypothetical protein KPH14_000854 [Odynerus spinipes]
MSHPVGEALNCKSKTCNHFKLLEVNISAKLIKGNVPSIPSNNGYSQHIDYLEECNNQNLFITEDFDYNFSKLMQNQLYGKFGMTPLRRKYYLKPYDKKVHTRKDTKIYGDKVKMVFAFDYDLTKPSYIPMAISITDKAKILTIKLANLVNQCNHIIPTGGFLYSDTDSIHFSICDACLEKYESQVEIHKTKLGA